MEFLFKNPSLQRVVAEARKRGGLRLAS